MSWAAIFTILMSFIFGCESWATPYPIQFSIPEVKIIRELMHKDRDFAFITPMDQGTYIYQEEADYYNDYRRSYFAVTTKKGGWDCLRHYEILANGCIPYFVDLEQCPAHTMEFLPKELILEAMNLDGVSFLHIDHSKFDLAKYDDLLNRLIAYTREHLTTKKMAEYLLQTIGYKGTGNILFLTQYTDPDYLRCLTLVGLKEVLGNRIIDVPKVPHIYQNYAGDIKQLYGKGFTYTRIVEDAAIDRGNLYERIRNREFDLVIYGSVHRGTPYHDLVRQCYPPSKIVYLCGEDAHQCEYRNRYNLFLREL